MLMILAIAVAFFVCQIQKQAATCLPKARLYAGLSVSSSALNKPLYLRFILDTAADVNVMQVSVYKQCFMTVA